MTSLASLMPLLMAQTPGVIPTPPVPSPTLGDVAKRRGVLAMAGGLPPVTAGPPGRLPSGPQRMPSAGPRQLGDLISVANTPDPLAGPHSVQNLGDLAGTPTIRASHSIFRKDSPLWPIIGALGDGLMAANGIQPAF